MTSLKKTDSRNEATLRNEVVQGVNKTKLRGVLADQHLNWKHQISMITK